MSTIVEGGVTGGLKIIDGPTLEEEVEPSENVLNAELLPDTICEFDRSCQREYARIGHIFKDYEQFELFHMLPLPRKQKREILNRAIEIQAEDAKKEEEMIQSA